MLTSEYICVIMRKRKQEVCFLKGRKEEIKMRHCQYCDALNPDDALQCGNCGKSLPPAGKNIVSASDKIPENAGLKLQVLARIIFAVILVCGEILGYLNIKEEEIAIGVAYVLISPLLAYLNMIVLHAFGELCENVSGARYYLYQLNKK